MTFEITLDDLTDEGEVGLLVLDRTFTLGPLTDEGTVGLLGIERTWGPIAITPYPGEAGGTPASIIGDPTGGLSSPSVILPESAVQLTESDGTHVAWLAKAKQWTFRRDHTGLGSGSAVLARTDPLADELVWPRQLRFFDRGVPRERALIEPRSDTTIDPAEETGQEVQIGGRGALAVLAAGLVEPIALDLQPVQDSMQFSFAHPDYDATGWPAARNIGLFDVPTDWPGGGSFIWGPSGTHNFAPGGSVYFRGPSFTNPTDQVLAYVWHVDNIGRLYLDGAEIDALADFDPSNYLRTHERRYLTSAGPHRLAATAFNQGPSTPPGNPGHLRVTVHELDANGQLGTVIHTTTALHWKAYEFPQSRPPGLQRPGWTAGQILAWLLDKWEDRGGLPVARSFTNTRDTDGTAWPNILDFTATIGNDLTTVVLQLAESWIDVDMAAGADLVHAWVKDTRGQTQPLQLRNDGTAADACLKSLTHQTEPPLCTRALLRWKDGWTRVDNDDAIADGVYVERQIQVPLVATEAAAQSIGADLVAVYGVERVQATAQVRPRNPEQRPGVGYDVADIIEIPNRDLVLTSQVVQSWSHTVDRDGNIAWQVETGDLVLNMEERLQSWLKTFNDGAIGGRTTQPSPYRQEVLPTPIARPRDPIVSDHLATDATGECGPYPVVDYGTIEALHVAIPGGEGGTFEVYVNNDSIGAVLVVATTKGALVEIGYKVVPGDWVSVYSLAAVRYTASVRIS